MIKKTNEAFRRDKQSQKENAEIPIHIHKTEVTKTTWILKIEDKIAGIVLGTKKDPHSFPIR